MTNSLYKKKLNPNFWDSKKAFNLKVRRRILKIVKDFLSDIDLDIPICDIRLTGSIANFNYNKFSDLDIHIVTKFKEINKDTKLVKQTLDDIRYIWNLKHNICIRGHEVELYFENKGEPHTATGLYSLLRDKWIRVPEYNPPDKVDLTGLKDKVKQVSDLVNRLYKHLNRTKDKKEIKLIHNKAKLIKNKIMRVRGEALSERGEFAIENLLFKKLRNNGTIEKIINLINLSYDNFFTESLKFNKTTKNAIERYNTDI